MIRLYSKIQQQQQKDFKQKGLGLGISWQWARGFNSVAFLQTFSPKHRLFFAWADVSTVLSKMGRSFFMAPPSQPRNWHSLNLEMVTTNLALLYIHWLFSPKTVRPCRERFDKIQKQHHHIARQKKQYLVKTWVLSRQWFFNKRSMQRQALSPRDQRGSWPQGRGEVEREKWGLHWATEGTWFA